MKMDTQSKPLRLLRNLVAADVSPLHIPSHKVRADSRSRLRGTGLSPGLLPGVLALCLLAILLPERCQGISFTEVTAGDLTSDTVGGYNITWVDIDEDDRLDVSVAPGTRNPVVAIPLYHQELDGTFTKITTNAIGLTAVWAAVHVWADINNDGKPDLFVPNGGPGTNDTLFCNLGHNAFNLLTGGHPCIDGANSKVGVLADYNLDGFLDLFVSVSGTPPLDPNDLLYQGNGDGTFRKMIAAEVGPLLLDGMKGDVVVWADVDNDGRPEICRIVAVSGTSNWTNEVWHVDDEGKFYLMDIGEMKMGNVGYTAILWADYNNDGLLDGFVAAEKGSPGLYRNLGGMQFTNVTASAFPVPLANSVAFWTDYDNDGWQDVVVTTYTSPTRNTVFRNNGDGTFTSQDLGALTSITGGWFIWGDYNNDGFLDALMQFGANKNNRLFRSDGNANHWLKVKLDGRASNRSGIGAKVRVQATIGGRTFWQMREISCELHGLNNGLLAHFGLGDATNVTTLRIEWPSGIVQELPNVAADQFLTVVESQGYTNAPPEFASAVKDASGLQLAITEPAAGARYILEASTDLITWTKLLAGTSVGGTSQFTDTRSADYPQRFYRLQVP